MTQAERTTVEEEDEFDQKENIPLNQENGTIKTTSEPVKFEINDKIVHLSRYWPEGSGIKGNVPPQDKSLLYLFSQNVNLLCQAPPAKNKLTEMVRMYESSPSPIYPRSPIREYIPYDAPLEVRKDFIAQYYRAFYEPVIVLRHINCPSNKKCCDIAKIRTNWIKIFAVGERISYYLKIDEPSHPDFSEDFGKMAIYWYLRNAYFEGEIKEVEPNGVKIMDTFDYHEAEIPNGFKVPLRDYQLRTISWMKLIEQAETCEANTIYHSFCSSARIDFKLGDLPYYLGRKSSHFDSLFESPRKDNGGILADDTGSGKTITTLGLIHSSPFTNETKAVRMARFKDSTDNYFESRASCIICPSNIHKQWLQEAKRCNPKLIVYGISNIHDHKKVSFKDLMEADIVIVSVQFLVNTNYVALRMKTFEDNTKVNVKQMKDIRGSVFLEFIHFHRVIIDEFHEIPDAKDPVKKAIKTLHGDYFWGLTGTPKEDTYKDLAYLKAPKGFARICHLNVTARYEFIRKHMKRNVPDLQLPEIQTETVWIDLTSNELSLLKWNSQSSSITEQIMMCSHYQLSEKGLVNVNDFVPVEVAQKRMCAKKQKEIEKLTTKLIQQEVQILKLIEKGPEKEVAVAELTKELKATEKTLQNAQSSMNYFKNVFKVIDEPEAHECRICYDKIDESYLAILPCSHLFCFGCIAPYVEKSHACPLCRFEIAKVAEIYRIRIEKPEKLPENLTELDISKYSSKLIGLYRYITELIQSDANARIILFLQFSDLANFIEETFKKLKVECVRVAGTVFQRQNAINKFRYSKDVRLIMMSSEDSVSGINLTQATHVILLHPFWTEKGEAVDLAYEKQGISRAYRFGLDHPLKIVRFAVRGTIEEEITLRRQNIKY